MVEEGRCARPWEIQRHLISKSHHEASGEHLGWEDPKESRARIGRRTTGILKEKGTTDGMFALRQLVEERLEMQGRMAIGFVDLLRKMMHADDLAIIAESKQELQEVLEEWKGVFKKHGLRMSREKTEVMWIGHQRSSKLDGFVYLGGKVTEDGHSEVEVRRRIQAEANAWRKAEGVMLDRNIEKKTERESPECACYTSMPVWSGHSGVDRTTTTAAASL